MDKPPVTILTSLAFEEEAARIAAGMSREQYDLLPGTPEWITDEHLTSKCHVLAFYRLNSRINGIIQQVQIQRSRRK